MWLWLCTRSEPKPLHSYPLTWAGGNNIRRRPGSRWNGHFKHKGGITSQVGLQKPSNDPDSWCFGKSDWPISPRRQNHPSPSSHEVLSLQPSTEWRPRSKDGSIRILPKSSGRFPSSSILYWCLSRILVGTYANKPQQFPVYDRLIHYISQGRFPTHGCENYGLFSPDETVPETRHRIRLLLRLA